ncbi:quinoprotein glucose dehydrogenase [Paenibacillus sambharensis]|uniref:Quinoprotein glucose dehydrogenase n=2 Tax=Paenibacillus sambharensis TaxID=1803190 RepID=A0A2W1LAE7_9BACL|nr:quinoprotein glucose dehydrogenase [Paenibacillus sambharensis]
MHIRTAAVMVAAVLTIIGCSNESKPAPAGQQDSREAADTITEQQAVNNDSAEESGGYEVIATDLESPWSIAPHENVIYISEREGTIARVEGQELTREAVNVKQPVVQRGEGGLLGLELFPDFGETARAYAYHTYETEGELMNRIVVLERTEGQWNEVDVILEGIPGAMFHDGGRLKLGPDGYLYATTGDAQQEELAQQLESLAGKILRMNRDGSVPEDNPFAGSLVYSYGHRNPQGIAWSNDGNMYSMEHGPSGSPGGHDELNIIQPGLNYGWPAIIGDETSEGMEQPLYHSGNDTLAPSGMEVSNNGDILAAGLMSEQLVRFSPDGVLEEIVLDEVGRIRDVRFHNGQLYVITNNTDGRGNPGSEDDRLLRMELEQ